MKIVITNAYTWYNKGDAGILLGIVETLKKIYNNNELEVNILSFTPEEDRKRYCMDSVIKDVQSNILNPHPYKHTRLGKIYALIKLAIKFVYISVGMKINRKKIIKDNKALELLEKSDYIIVCGGGFLGGKKIDSLIHLFQININNKFNKPVYIMGTSIEPINNKILKLFTEKVLKKVNFTFAREKITEEYLNTFLEKDKHILIPDMAFMIEDKKTKFEFLNDLRKKSNILVGLTVRNWSFPNSKDKKKSRENYIIQMVKFMEYYIKKENVIFVFIPQVIVNYANDVDVAEVLKNRISKECSSNFVIRKDDWSPLEIKNLIGQLDYFVGTRMHSNIFATSMYVPTLAIAYEKKTNGIMETVNQSYYVENIDQICSNAMIKKFDTMIKNKANIVDELKMVRVNIKKEILEKTSKILLKNN